MKAKACAPSSPLTQGEAKGAIEQAAAPHPDPLPVTDGEREAGRHCWPLHADGDVALKPRLSVVCVGSFEMTPGSAMANEDQRAVVMVEMMGVKGGASGVLEAR